MHTKCPLAVDENTRAGDILIRDIFAERQREKIASRHRAYRRSAAGGGDGRHALFLRQSCARSCMQARNKARNVVIDYH